MNPLVYAYPCQDFMSLLDASSIPLSIEKDKKPFELLRKSEQYIEAFTNVSNIDSYDFDNLQKTIEEFTTKMYGLKGNFDVNSARVLTFVNNYKMKEKYN